MAASTSNRSVRRSEDWIGHREANLTIIAFDGVKDFSKGRACYFTFKCDCGKEFSAQKSNVIGKKKDCGCSRPAPRASASPGAWQHPLYGVWRGMLDRCDNPNVKSYADYGARGVTVCDRWRFGDNGKSGFDCFVEDMGERPDGFTIERSDFNGNYEPANCLWISKPDQGKNARGVRRITIDGVTRTLPEWCDISGVKYFTAHRRIVRGWPPEKAIFTQPHKGA